MISKKVNVIGAGFAGVEVVNYLANKGFQIELFEMRPEKKTEAHETSNFAEPLCSNSFKSNLPSSPSGALKSEMRLMNSIILKCAEEAKVPAGEALAVDREIFGKAITNAIETNKNIKIKRKEITSLSEFANDEIVVIASGPLTSENLMNEIGKLFENENLYFYDAISPIVSAESVDMNYAFIGSRFDKGDDYINCVLTKEEYELFVNELANAELVKAKIKNEIEEKWQFYPGCTPIEAIAKGGVESLRHAQLSPKGFALHGKPYAIIQLRKENKEASSYSLVGFQTRLTYSEQKRVFKLIPALKNAEFLRLGSVHRNSFINAPTVLDDFMRVKLSKNIFFAGQIAGVEGYVESAAHGLLVAYFIEQILNYKFANKKNENPEIGEIKIPPANTMMGALYRHTRNPQTPYQPSGINFGLINDIDFTSQIGKYNRRDKKGKREAIALAATENFKEWIKNEIK